jgi:hypothetical protein
MTHVSPVPPARVHSFHKIWHPLDNRRPAAQTGGGGHEAHHSTGRGGRDRKQAAEILTVLNRHFTDDTTILVTGNRGKENSTCQPRRRRRADRGCRRRRHAPGGRERPFETAARSARCRLGIILGTGRFAGSLGLPRDRGPGGPYRPGRAPSVDVGHAFFSGRGTAAERYFINEWAASAR